MQTTANLGLKKPEGNDVVNINDFNDNADKLDTEIKKILNSVGDLTQLSTTAKNNLVVAINEVLGKFNSIKLEAENVTIKDLENLFTATKVEGALSEVMKKAKANETSISLHNTKIANIENELGTNRSKLITEINNVIDLLA